MPISVNIDKGLDKGYESKSLDEILAAPPSVLAGLTPDDDKLLAQLGIKTVRDLGSNKHFALAGALVALSTKTG
jgi:predicted RecB family nuclease